MSAFWITFADGTQGCVEFRQEAFKPSTEVEVQVRALVETDMQRPVTKVARLPYPAEPRLITVYEPGIGACPSFCFHPHKCVGRSSCPRPLSCDD